jgi:LEA14-like dessication related protein
MSARSWPAAAIAVALAGCGAQAPRIAVGAMEVSERGPDAMELRCALELTNESTESVELDELRYTVTIDGIEAYEGRRSAEATLAGSSTRRLVLPVVVDPALLEAAAGGPATWSISGTLRYKAPGDLAQLLVDMKVQRPTTSFAGEGVIADSGR